MLKLLNYNKYSFGKMVESAQVKRATQLHVLNSLGNAKVPFEPAEGNAVTWYICGPTVYDESHIGHARNYVVNDIIRRIMRDYLGY